MNFVTSVQIFVCFFFCRISHVFFLYFGKKNQLNCFLSICWPVVTFDNLTMSAPFSFHYNNNSNKLLSCYNGFFILPSFHSLRLTFMPCYQNNVSTLCIYFLLFSFQYLIHTFEKQSLITHKQTQVHTQITIFSFQHHPTWERRNPTSYFFSLLFIFLCTFFFKHSSMATVGT